MAGASPGGGGAGGVRPAAGGAAGAGTGGHAGAGGTAHGGTDSGCSCQTEPAFPGVPGLLVIGVALASFVRRRRRA